MQQRKTDKKSEVMAHNYDIALKEGMRLFEQNILSFLHINEDAEIVQNINPESITIEVKKSIADMFFLLDDGSGLNIEWQARITWEDMLRFQSYSVLFMERFKLKAMQTVILTRERPRVENISYASGAFCPIIINLAERNAGETFERIKTQIALGEEINPLEIIYMGLYNGDGDRSVAEILKDTISLLEPSEKNPNLLEQVLPLILVANGRLLSRKDAKEIMEVIRMKIDDNPVLEALQEIFEESGIEKGMIRGRETTQIETASRAIENGLSFDLVAKITGLSLKAVEELAGQTA